MSDKEENRLRPERFSEEDFDAAFKVIKKAADERSSATSKHLGGQHDQSSHAHGGGTRAQLAKRTHKPSTKEKQRKGEAEQARLAKLIGGTNTDDNKAFDVLLGKHAIEVKTLIDNDNDKLTVHPESRRRKEGWAKQHKAMTHTIAIDTRGGKRAYYYKSGVGAYRVRSMQKVSIPQLKELLG